MAALHAVQWEAGSKALSDTLELAGVWREPRVVDKVMHGTIYRLVGGVVGHWLWKPWKKHKRARDPWRYSPRSADQPLNHERIMANTRKDDLAVHVKDPLGNVVKPHLLGVILSDFTEWALPYVLVEDDGQFVGAWGGLVRVTHTTNLEPWDQRLLRHLVRKPLFHKRKYQLKDTVGMYRTPT